MLIFAMVIGLLGMAQIHDPAPNTFFTLKQTGTAIHLTRFAQSGKDNFNSVSDVVIIDLVQDHIAGRKLKYARLSPRGTWLAVAIDDDIRDNANRVVYEMPRSLAIVN